jgi:predicted transcriptional regulator
VNPSKQTKVLRRNQKETAVTFQLEPALKKRLEKAARKQDRSVSFIVRSAVQQLLDGMKEDGVAA